MCRLPTGSCLSSLRQHQPGGTERSSYATERGHTPGRRVGGDTIGLVLSFPRVAPGKALSISATLYVTFTRCPDQALGRVHGVYPEETIASFRGGLAHRVFARHLERGPIGSDEFEKVCREEIGTGLNPSLGALGLRPSQLAPVVKEVGDLYQRFKAVIREGFRDADVFIELEPAAGVTLRGSIDAVFDDAGGVCLVDWKTGGLHEIGSQLGFYAMLWALDRGELPTRVEALSIASGERFEAEPSLASVTETAASVAAMVTMLRRAADEGRDELERIGGPWCSFCPLLDSCTEGAAAVRITTA